MSEINKAKVNTGPTFYGKPVENINDFDRWLMVTAWPTQHDEVIMACRQFNARCIELHGLLWPMFNAKIIESAFTITKKDEEPVAVYGYFMEFAHPLYQPDKAMFGVFLEVDREDDYRTTKVWQFLFHDKPESYTVEKVQ